MTLHVNLQQTPKCVACVLVCFHQKKPKKWNGSCNFSLRYFLLEKSSNHSYYNHYSVTGKSHDMWSEENEANNGVSSAITIKLQLSLFYAATTVHSPFNVILNILPLCWQVNTNTGNPCTCCTITNVPLAFTLALLLEGGIFWPFISHTVLGSGPTPLKRQARQRVDWLVTRLSEPVMLNTFSGIQMDSAKKMF